MRNLINKLLLINIVTALSITACNSGASQTGNYPLPGDYKIGDIIFPQNNYQIKFGESIVVGFTYTYSKQEPEKTIETQIYIQMESSIAQIIEPPIDNESWYKPTAFPNGIGVRPGNQYYMNIRGESVGTTVLKVSNVQWTYQYESPPTITVIP